MPRELKGPNPDTGAGRPARRKPNDGAGPDWLAEPFSDPIQETARQFAINLKTEIDRVYGDASGRHVAGQLHVDHNSLRKILNGISYPDLPFIVSMENAFGKKLWPDRRDETTSKR